MFATFWDWLDERIGDKIVIAPDEVFVELQAKAQSPLAKWIKTPERKERVFQPHDEDVQHQFKDICARFPSLLTKGKPQAKSDGDAWVIALAKVRNATCVAEDRRLRAGTSFPEVCRHYGVPLVLLREFIERESSSK